MEPPADWPFDESPNVTRLTTRGVIDGSEWIATVSHDEDDGAWQVIGVNGASMDQAMLVALRQLFERDPSIGELADLPEGWSAWRDSPDSPWQRSPKCRGSAARNKERGMFSHIVVGSNDLDRSKQFYDGLFGKEARRDDKGRLSYGRRGSVFMVTSPIDGEAATHGNGATIGFGFDTPEEVDAWHAAGVAAGGTPIEDPPGYRENAFGKLYLAYLRDPDGNKLCGLHRPEQ